MDKKTKYIAAAALGLLLNAAALVALTSRPAEAQQAGARWMIATGSGGAWKINTQTGATFYCTQYPPSPRSCQSVINDPFAR